MYGEQHLLTYKSQEKSKVVYGLSYKQLAWWIAGGLITMKAVEIIPPLPGIGYAGYLPHLIPSVICLAFAHIKHPSTGMGLLKFISSSIMCRIKKRIFL